VNACDGRVWLVFAALLFVIEALILRCKLRGRVETASRAMLGWTQ